jgi:hypothetical protein
MLQDATALFSPVGQAVKAGDNLAAASILLDVVDDRTGVLQTWPPELQAVVKDNARTLAVPQQDPPVLTCEQLGEIKPRITIVRGEKTRSFFRLVADTAARCMPKGIHQVVPGERHLWPGDDPQGFSQHLLAFLNGSDPAKGRVK